MINVRPVSELEAPTDEEIDECLGDHLGREITPENALVVIAREMRMIRHVLEDSLETSGCEHRRGRGIADVLEDVALGMGHRQLRGIGCAGGSQEADGVVGGCCEQLRGV